MISEKNYKVSFLGRSGVRYTEDKRNLSIFSELLAGDDYDMVIYLNQASQWEDGAPLSEEDRVRIKGNITRELKSTRVDWD